MKRLFCVFLVLLILSSNAIVLGTNGINNYINQYNITPCFLYILLTENYLTYTDNDNELRCKASTVVYDGYFSETIMELQIKDGDWTTIHTWKSKIEADWTIFNELYQIKDNTKHYRLKITHSAYDKNGKKVDSTTSYSNEV